MLDNQAASTQKLQENADINTAIARYNTDPKTFLQQAEGAFAVMSDLIGQGLIDEQGKVIPAAPTLPQPTTIPPAVVQPASQPIVPGQPSTISDDAVARIVAKALDDKLTPVQKAIGELDNTQTNMIRTTLGTQIKAAHPDLSDQDISQVFATAMKDNTKDLFGHAEVVAAQKKEMLGAYREHYAKEFGIDLAEHDANKLWEQGPEGGAAAVFKGKKFSFKDGKDSISPRRAAENFFKGSLKG